MSDAKDKEITAGALADAYRQCIAHMKVRLFACFWKQLQISIT